MEWHLPNPTTGSPEVIVALLCLVNFIFAVLFIYVKQFLQLRILIFVQSMILLGKTVTMTMNLFFNLRIAPNPSPLARRIQSPGARIYIPLLRTQDLAPSNVLEFLRLLRDTRTGVNIRPSWSMKTNFVPSALVIYLTPLLIMPHSSTNALLLKVLWYSPSTALE